MYIPPGYAAITPYFVVEHADGFIDFLVNGLGATEELRSVRPDGKIANVQMQLGGARFMVSETAPDFPPMSAAYYLYVEHADATMARACEHGAAAVMQVADMPYGDRQGGVRDDWGNLWWISQRLEHTPYSA